MAATWTTTELLAAIREEGRLSSDDTDATDANLLLAADRAMSRVFVPAIRTARADYYVTHEDQDITQGRSKYPIPSRAVGNTVRTVVWIDGSDREREIPPVPLSDQYLYTQATGVPNVYTIEDDQVILLPEPSGDLGTLRLVFEYRPNQLVPAASAAHMRVFNESSHSFGSVPSLPASIVANAVVDIILGTSPFSVLGSGITVSSVSGGIINLVVLPADDIPDRFTEDAVVDVYLAITGETPIPQIPAELHATLAQFTAGQWLAPIDPELSQFLKGEAMASLAAEAALLTPRQVGRQQKVHSRSSMMRRGRRRGRGFLGTF